jgi:copper homeostasis protein (lipoprotein)
MKIDQKLICFSCVLLLSLAACGGNKKSADAKKETIVLKGLYSYGPEIRSFTECEESKEYWVIDSAQTLELAYNNLGFEKPYTPVYIEVECKLVKSDTTLVPADFDSTMVVTKLTRIDKKIPEGPCSQ